MADPKLCTAPGCCKQTNGAYCSMHRFRLRRGGTLECRQPKKTISELLNNQTQFGFWTVMGEGEPYKRRRVKGKGLIYISDDLC